MTIRNVWWPGLGLGVGQNVAGGYRTWEAAIGGWHDEVKMYVFGRDPDSYLGKGGWMKIGHYTQVGGSVAVTE